MNEFNEILAIIGRHAKGSDTDLETLTRLFRKNQGAPTLAPLGRSTVRCWREERAKPWFSGLCNDVETGEIAEYDSGHSIVVLVRSGKEFILDGHKRCRLWYRLKDQSLHTSLFIEPL